MGLAVRRRGATCGVLRLCCTEMGVGRGESRIAGDVDRGNPSLHYKESAEFVPCSVNKVK
jgi:hypothetical protein